MKAQSKTWFASLSNLLEYFDINLAELSSRIGVKQLFPLPLPCEGHLDDVRRVTV